MILDILVYPDLYHDGDVGFTAFTCNLFQYFALFVI